MFIVLEGSDGSGKTTQFKLLAERLRAIGHEVDVYDFPRYNHSSSYFVQRYLNGEYGPAAEVSPYTASLFYALDRYEAAPLIRQSISDGKIVLANRFTGSNMAHQGSKFTRPAEQRGFFMWAESLEFQLLGIPRPSINIFLRVPAKIAYELIKKKESRSYTSKAHDEHEADIKHLRQSVATYDTLCRLFPKDFLAIDCTKGGQILPVAEINNRIWQVLKPLLPKPLHAGRPTVVSIKESTHGASQLKPEPRFEKEIAKTELKDVSLLALNNLRTQGVDLDYELVWPPKNLKGRLNYYIPAQLPPKLADKYRLSMDKMAKHSQQVAKSMPDSAKRYVVLCAPMAALVNARITGNIDNIGQALSNTTLGTSKEMNQIIKKKQSKYEEPQLLSAIIKQLAESKLKANSDSFDKTVKLINVSPRNELSLLADCLYSYSNLGRHEIVAEVDQWSYAQKADALEKILDTNPEAVLSIAHYQFDVISDALTLENLTKHLKVRKVDAQPLTPRYGYSVPEEVEQAAADEDFISCFDLSLELYSDIQSAGLDDLAGYAVLAGHRQRWLLSVSGSDLFAEYTRLPAETNGLIAQLREEVSEAHPLIGEIVSNISKIHQELASETPRKDNQKTKSKK